VAGCGGGNSGGVASLGGSATPTTTNATGSEGYDLPQALVFTRCMRQHGINMADPQMDGSLPNRGSGVDPDDPKFKAAERACPGSRPKY
jgi:hypothetical protein